MANQHSLRLLSIAVIVSISALLLVSASASAASVNLPRTGQTTCYNQTGQVIDCVGSGQDGEYQTGIPWPDPRFSDNADGTITDNLTGLTWLKDTECIGGIKWLEALDSVKLLANGSCGLTDGSVAGEWRMPNYLELISLANLGVADSITWFKSFGFTNLRGVGYWSSTSYISQPASSVLGYQFNHRFSGTLLKSGGYQTWPVKGVSTGPARIWKTGQTTCHGTTYESEVIPCAGTGQDGELQTGEPPPVIRFVDNGDGTVTDNLTGLIWLRNMDCFGPRPWLDTLANVNALASGDCSLTDGSSAGDWRLPNPLELLSLVDFSQTQPALPSGHPFTNFDYFFHWTSTSWRVLPSYAYIGSAASVGHYFYIDKPNAEGGVGWPVRGGNVTTLPDPIYADGFEGLGD